MLHITVYCISAQTVSCTICTQIHFIQKAEPKKHEFHTKTKTSYELYEWGELGRRTPETDSSSPWGSIEPSLRTTVIDCYYRAIIFPLGTVVERPINIQLVRAFIQN